jgi:hypothetical protein
MRQLFVQSRSSHEGIYIGTVSDCEDKDCESADIVCSLPFNTSQDAILAGRDLKETIEVQDDYPFDAMLPPYLWNFDA